MAEWAARHVGIPFAELGRDRAGCDCWGLVRLVYEQELGVRLPALDGHYQDSRARRVIASCVADLLPDWLPVEAGAEEPLDVALLNLAGLPVHVGVVVARGLMLHCMHGVDACLERYDGPVWRHRLEGIYRYRPPGAVP